MSLKPPSFFTCLDGHSYDMQFSQAALIIIDVMKYICESSRVVFYKGNNGRTEHSPFRDIANEIRS